MRITKITFEDKNGDFEAGTNPCSEIILRPNQFCNLSEVVVRAGDTLDDLKKKVEVATIIGTLQSTLTDFRYLRKAWKTNTEEERLLGVSLTGIMDHSVLSNPNSKDLPRWLEELKEVAIETNKAWAEQLGIPQSTAITCVKPSGTVSQLVDSASGIHGRFSKFYIRRVRGDAKDPLCDALERSGVPCEVDIMSPTTKVFTFYQKAPKGARMASEMSAMEQLKLNSVYQRHWCEHKVSQTVYYRDSEFLEVGQWIYNNFDDVSGISFLPFDEHTYKQAPYEEITEEQYLKGLEGFPKEILWDAIEEYSDTTEGSQTLACAGGACEIP